MSAPKRFTCCSTRASVHAFTSACALPLPTPTGPLPAAWANGTIASLRLHQNVLNGTLPAQWLPVLWGAQAVSLGLNKLSGPLPALWFNASVVPAGAPPLGRLDLGNNTCLCGGLPGWLSNITLASNTGLGLNCSDAGYVALGCGTPPPPAAWLLDVPALLALKAVAASTYDQQRLSSWDPSVPPCTSLAAETSCVLCSQNDACGALDMTGARRCNWRYLECRARRVVSVNMNSQVWC